MPVDDTKRVQDSLNECAEKQVVCYLCPEKFLIHETLVNPGVSIQATPWSELPATLVWKGDPDKPMMVVNRPPDHHQLHFRGLQFNKGSVVFSHRSLASCSTIEDCMWWDVKQPLQIDDAYSGTFRRLRFLDCTGTLLRAVKCNSSLFEHIVIRTTSPGDDANCLGAIEILSNDTTMINPWFEHAHYQGKALIYITGQSNTLIGVGIEGGKVGSLYRTAIEVAEDAVGNSIITVGGHAQYADGADRPESIVDVKAAGTTCIGVSGGWPKQFQQGLGKIVSEATPGHSLLVTGYDDRVDK